MFDPKVILSIEFLRVFLRHSWSLLKHCNLKCVMLYDCYLYITEAIYFFYKYHAISIKNGGDATSAAYCFLLIGIQTYYTYYKYLNILSAKMPIQDQRLIKMYLDMYCSL